MQTLFMLGSERMKKVLFTATVDSHILHFHIPFLKYFKENGYEVHVATSENDDIPYCDKKIQIPFERSPYSINNLKAIKKLKKVIMEEKYDIIHTHTPMGSVVTRLAAKKARKKYHTRVIYTAHGFHFYKGASKFNWMLFYPVEKYLSKYTDILITINNEDYELAKNKFKKCKDIEYVPGVGIDEKKFNFNMSDKEKSELRKSLGLKDDDFVMICVARLDKNKNQGFLIEITRELISKNKNIHLLLVGPDELNGIYQEQSKEILSNVHFLGYSNIIPKLMKISNIAVSASLREGLPVNILEALASNLPVVAIDARGVRDLIEDDVNGYVVSKNNHNDKSEFINKIEIIYNNKEIYNKLKNGNKEEIKKYFLDKIIENMKNIYQKKKKVLHILASNRYSGAENVACNIIQQMSDKYDMAYCSPCGKIKETLENKNIKYFEIEKLNKKNIKKIINEYKPDIIHAHDFKASIVSSSFYKKIWIISHLHKNDPKLKKISIKSMIYLFISRKFKNVVGVSSSILNEYIFKSSIQDKYVVLYNCVDMEKIIEMSNEYKIDKKYDYFYLGRLSEEKKPVKFINIIDEISKIKKVNAIMIGDGNLKEQCKELIENKKLDIELVGFKDNPFPYIKNSNVGIMPSKFEGFGLAALECSLLGKPVFNSGVGGLKEIFKDSKEFICSDDEYINKIEKYKNKKVIIDKKFYDIEKYKDILNSIYN